MMIRKITTQPQIMPMVSMALKRVSVVADVSLKLDTLCRLQLPGVMIPIRTALSIWIIHAKQHIIPSANREIPMPNIKEGPALAQKHSILLPSAGDSLPVFTS